MLVSHIKSTQLKMNVSIYTNYRTNLLIFVRPCTMLKIIDPIGYVFLDVANLTKNSKSVTQE